MSLLGAIVAGCLCGVLGLLVPRLIAAVPEPAPREDEAEAEEAQAEEAEADDAHHPRGGEEGLGSGEPEAPKPLYVDLAARPHLGAFAAFASLVCGALVGAATGWDWQLVWLVPLVPVAVTLAYIDWRTRLLPTVVVLSATLYALVAMVAVGLATDQRDAVIRAVVAMLVARSFFWLLWWFYEKGMGFGDVRLAALIGLVVGWVGLGPMAIGLWIGMVAFSLPGLLLAIARRDPSLLRKSFPFGPFMLVGALVGLVWGPDLTRAFWG